jgi:hypothetical protein
MVGFAPIPQPHSHPYPHHHNGPIIDNPYDQADSAEKGLGIAGIAGLAVGSITHTRAPSTTVLNAEARLLSRRRSLYILYLSAVVSALVLWNAISEEFILGNHVVLGLGHPARTHLGLDFTSQEVSEAHQLSKQADDGDQRPDERADNLLRELLRGPDVRDPDGSGTQDDDESDDAIDNVAELDEADAVFGVLDELKKNGAPISELDSLVSSGLNESIFEDLSESDIRNEQDIGYEDEGVQEFLDKGAPASLQQPLGTETAQQEDISAAAEGDDDKEGELSSPSAKSAAVGGVLAALPASELNSLVDGQKSSTASLQPHPVSQLLPSSKSASLAALPLPLLDRLQLWLHGNEGINLDTAGKIKLWSDRKGVGFEAPESAYGLQVLKDEIKRYNVLHRLSPAPEERLLDRTSAQPSTARVGEAGLAMIDFPCSLKSRSFMLSENSSLFFVLKPEWIGMGAQAPGQRFFGTYPSGQMRLNDGRLSLKIASGEGSLMNPELQLRAGEIALVGYRFSKGKAAGSVNGSNWEPLVDQKGRPILAKKFTSEPAVLGGTRPDLCDFMGSIGEVMIFDHPLDGVDSHAVMQYLMRKWSLGSPVSPEVLEQKGPAIGQGSLLQAVKSQPKVPAIAAKESEVYRRVADLPSDKDKSPPQSQDGPERAIPGFVPPPPLPQQVARQEPQQKQVQQPLPAMPVPRLDNGIVRENGSCRIEGSRVMEWDAPLSADVRSRHRWQDAQKESMERVGGIRKL